MAGSLNHIVGDDGAFTMLTIERMGEAGQALAECHQIIALMLARAAEMTGMPAGAILKRVCNDLAFPVPNASGQINPKSKDVTVPVIEPRLHGPASIFRRDA